MAKVTITVEDDGDSIKVAMESSPSIKATAEGITPAQSLGVMLYQQALIILQMHGCKLSELKVHGKDADGNTVSGGARFSQDSKPKT